MNRQKLQQRKRRIRARIHGTAAVPRVSVYRSARSIGLQLIDDDAHVTLASATGRAQKGTTKTAAATSAAAELAKAAQQKKVKQVVFDRGGYLYHGRVKAAAEALREAGLLT